MALPLKGIGLGSIGVGMLSNYMGGNPQEANDKRLQDQYNSINGTPASAGFQGFGGLFNGLGARPGTPGRADPQAGLAAQSGQSGFRANQQELISRLEALSKGQGPSLAAEQLKQATNRNMGQQASIAQSGRGNAALANMTAANNAGMLGAQSASDSAVARIAEQQMALQQLGSAVGTGREQDQSNSQFNALQTNYRDQFNVEAQLRARGMNDEQIRAILQMQQQSAAKPSFGDQLMAGGAGLLSMGASGGKPKA